MADEAQLKLLKTDIRQWNKWRSENLDVKIDLSHAAVAGSYLCGANFRQADLSGAILDSARMQQTNLWGANLTDADMCHTMLCEANLMRAKFTNTNLYSADLSNANLWKAELSEARLAFTNLTAANLEQAVLVDAIFWDANCCRANLKNTNMLRCRASGTNFSQADLSNTKLEMADLSKANFTDAIVTHANLQRASLSGATLTRCKFTGSSLEQAVLVNADLTQADIGNCRIYGLSVWDLVGLPANQNNLIISKEGDATITVDDMELAQFIYLLLKNEKLKNVIDTITSKAVLILGRFSAERKEVLDAIRAELRQHNFTPIIFDFDKPASRDLTETVSTLAHLARFVIADLTDAKSIPQELTTIVPHLPSVPIQPILLTSQLEYAMFEHWRHYPWVLPEFLYNSKTHLLDNLQNIVQPALQWKQAKNDTAKLKEKVLELEKQLASLTAVKN